jgi:prepilin-type N-terminal cleavage/methylation domain-containing protein
MSGQETKIYNESGIFRPRQDGTEIAFKGVKTSFFRLEVMRKRAAGFTVLELVVAIVVGGILTQMAIKGFGMVASQISAREARTVFHGMLARTRAQAIESGATTALLVSAAGDSAMILANGRIVETIRFMERMGVDIQAPDAFTRICINPRGFADTQCNSFESTTELSFVSGTGTETISILPLGQVRW